MTEKDPKKEQGDGRDDVCRDLECVKGMCVGVYQMSRRLELSSKYPLTCTGRPLGTGRGRKQ
jgi:hypothetical protein